jgi:DNA-binding NtrC family response regulator
MARILVVDDQPHITLCLEVFLRREGHEVMRAGDGRSALRLLRAESFDVLITDVDMPGLDGLSLIGHQDVVARLRGIVVLTGRTDYEKIAAIREQVAVHVAPKPFSPTSISGLVAELVSHAAQAAAPVEAPSVR